MYAKKHDEQRSLAVWAFSAPSNEEWDRHFEDLREIATWSKKTGKRVAAVMMPLGMERPDPARRAELAALTEAAGYDPFIAFIAPNQAVRGLLTMMKWMQKRPQYTMQFFSDVESGIAWLEAQRKEPLPELRRMVQEVESNFVAA